MQLFLHINLFNLSGLHLKSEEEFYFVFNTDYILNHPLVTVKITGLKIPFLISIEA